MEKLDVILQQNSEHAAPVCISTAEAIRVAATGSESVMQMVAKMRDIGQTSQKIGNSISLIDMTAFQTNTLHANRWRHRDASLRRV